MSDHMSTNEEQDPTTPTAAHTPHALPLTYGYPFLTLLPRDPHCVFAHWEIPPSARAAGGEHGATLPPTLRLYAFGPEGTSFSDVTVADRASMYIHQEHPGGTLGAQIGLLAGTVYIPIVTSNIVQLPPGPFGPTTAGDAPAPWAGVLMPGPVFPAAPGTFMQGETTALAGSSDFSIVRNRLAQDNAP